MAQLALEIQNNAPRGRGPATTSIPSSFTVALDTVSTSNLLREENNAKIVSGSTSADVLGNCRVSEEAPGFAYTLKGGWKSV
jgi:hypothetical protein